MSDYTVVKVGKREFHVPDEWVTSPGRYWEFIVWEDSAPRDWVYQLDMTGLKVAISPYHDKDIIEGTIDEPKKPHWHVLCCWENKTTFKHALNFSVMLGCNIPKRKDNLQGAWEYHTHKNHADKFQYSDKERRYLNGLTKSDIAKLSQEDIRSLTNEVLSIACNLGLFEYAQLVDYLRFNQMYDYFDFVCTHTLFFNSYLKSHRHSRQNKNENE